jgi:hypothetical protein
MKNKGTDTTTRNRTPFKIFIRILYFISFIVFFYYLIDGLPYYKTAIQQRPYHENYRNLRPAGFRSHGFGVIGSGLMIFMLIYTVRKRTKFMRRWGALSKWLDIHIYCGVMGPLLIILHTSFKVQGLVAVSFWSMIAVALSGVLGRYLYLQIPRNVRGDELSMKELDDLGTQINKEIKEEISISEDELRRLEMLISPNINPDRGVLYILAWSLKADLTRPFRLRKIQKRFSLAFNIPPTQMQRLIINLRRKLALNRRILLLNQIQRLFHYWHVFHKPFAIIMYIIMLIHVGVAVWLGYSWIF